MTNGARDVQAIVLNKHGIGHMARVKRFPQPGETVRALEWHFGEDGGKGTNAAVALSLQGIKTALICKVGQDDGGRLGEKWLKDAGVDCSRYIMTPEIATDVGVVIAREDGENMVIGSPKHDCYLSEEEMKEAIDAFPGAKWFLSGFELSQPLALAGCRYAHEQGKTTVLNPSPLVDRIDHALDYVDYLFVNEVEGAQMMDASGEERNWMEIAEGVWKKYRPGTVVMTLGDEGCIVCRDGSTAHYPAYDVECVDTVAAGDGFMAAFVACLIKGMSCAGAADWGNRYSAVVVSRAGAILSYPSLEEAEAASSGLRKHQNDGGA